MVVHGNNSKSRRCLPHRFLLPLFMNIVEFPLKSRQLSGCALFQTEQNYWLFHVEGKTKLEVLLLCSCSESLLCI